MLWTHSVIEIYGKSQNSGGWPSVVNFLPNLKVFILWKRMLL